MEEIFGYGPIIYPNEVECCLEEFQSSTAHSFLPRIAPSCKKRPAMDTSTDDEDYIHIKSKYARKRVVKTKKQTSILDKKLETPKDISQKMNDYKVTKETLSQLGP